MAAALFLTARGCAVILVLTAAGLLHASVLVASAAADACDVSNREVRASDVVALADDAHVLIQVDACDASVLMQQSSRAEKVRPEVRASEDRQGAAAERGERPPVVDAVVAMEAPAPSRDDDPPAQDPELRREDSKTSADVENGRADMVIWLKSLRTHTGEALASIYAHAEWGPGGLPAAGLAVVALSLLCWMLLTLLSTCGRRESPAEKDPLDYLFKSQGIVQRRVTM